MSRRSRGRIGRSTRRQALPAFGFLRPLAQREEEEHRFRQRLRENPSLRREYRSGLILQLVVVGGLLLGCTVLLVQSLTLIEAFQKAKGRKPWSFETKAYSGSVAALKVLEATEGDTTPEKLREAIMSIDYESVEGRLRLDQTTRIAIRNVYIVKIDKIGGNYELVPVKTFGEVPPRGF